MQNKKISLLTYNIIQYPTIPYITKRNYYKKERLKAMSQRFSTYDILCLQEMFRLFSEDLDEFLSSLKKCGFRYFYIIDLNGHFQPYQCDGGVMIVSKFRIVHAEQRQWPRGIKADGVLTKGGVYCQVDVPGNPLLHLVNIHVQATYQFDSEEIQAMTVVARQRQFEVLKFWLLDIFKRFEIKKNELFLMCGDFNMDALHINQSIREYFKSICFEGETEDSNELQKLRNSENLFSFFMNYMGYKNDTFQLENVYYKHHQEYPITFGEKVYDSYNNRIQEETVLTDKEEYFFTEALDYIFQIRPTNSFSSTIKDKTGIYLNRLIMLDGGMQVVDKSSKVQKFKQKIKGTPITQLSDHFGISCDIKIC
jgi:endonuclease/exonuclease/phosphatase family metal-dependent hydrolase